MNEPTRLHRLFILFPLADSVKSLIPIAALVSIKFLNGKSLRDIPWYWLSAAIVILVSLLLLYGYLKWKRFVYTLEEDKILIRRGVLFREELSIYTGRIHSMNMEQPLLQRLLGLTQVRIETPGKKEGGGGILPAVTNSEGERLQRWLREQTQTRQADRDVHPAAENSGRSGQSLSSETERPSVPSPGTPEAYESVHHPSYHNRDFESVLLMDSESTAAGREKASRPIPAEEERSTLLQLSSGRLLIAALSSPNLSLALAFVGGIVSFADDLLPDRMYQSLFQSAGKLLPGSWISIAALALIVSWLLSAVLYTIKYAGFTVERFGKQISVSCGLLERKRLLFSPERVLAITVKEGVFRRWFGYAEVKVHVLTSESEKHFMLHPLLKTGDIPALLKRVTPQFSAQAISASPPPRARWMYVRWKLAFAAAVSAACIWYFDRLGLLSLLLLPLSFAWGLLSHRDSGLNVTGKQLTIRSRFIAMSTRYIRRPQIIAMEVSGTRRQRRKGLLSLQVKMIFSEINESLSGMEQQEIEAVRAWFQQKKGETLAPPERSGPTSSIERL
ncbi:PH domain-containing protein [Paenibacillus sp. FSL H8-0457]|uniref:PH domain-containing protein n=1 Tax=unclassified Paenibacillus TaxID=185978 RepID=UPI0001789635|nr:MULTISPECIES: PH domain-containing protein [unclassified Paenibacillus]ACX63567.1 membrane-flanked domain protein [Paenibacillus sp. Y412MC10]ETT64621.1 membrane-flanked domain-containing protein [Paenibacillus sp. FSL H8-457]